MSNYSDLQYKELTLKIREEQKELPPFVAEFMRGIENNTLVRTRYAYICDLRMFFTFLTTSTDMGKKIDCVKNITLSDLDSVTVTDIEMYLNHLSLYENENGETVTNEERSKARKLSAIRAMYKYFCKKEKILHNSPALIETPTIHDKNIIRLEPNEVANLLDAVESGEGLTDRQKKFNERTKKRDLAILTLFLGTGIRISELVGIDMDDINFSESQFSIIRKGGSEDILVFGDEARRALLEYMLEREKIVAYEGHENAMFLSLQRKRLTARAVEILVEKYAKVTVPLKKITPHKLRSTYGTNLYNETGDIYLVADVLGHKDVNTTRKHYVPVAQDRRRLAAKVVKLRDD